MSVSKSHKDHALMHHHGENHLALIEDFVRSRKMDEPACTSADERMWNGHVKMLIQKGIFPQTMDFIGVGSHLDVRVRGNVSKIGEYEYLDNLKPEKVISYPLYRSGGNYATILPSASGDLSLKGGLVKMSPIGCDTGALSTGLQLSNGVEGTLVTEVGQAQLVEAMNAKLEMRQMALRGMLLLRQLTLLHASEPSEVDLQASTVEEVVHNCDLAAALLATDDYDVVVDTSLLTNKQLEILCAISTDWPFQRIMYDEEYQDVYSRCKMMGDSVFLYNSQGAGGNVSFKGLSMTPEAYWSELAQLFSNLGCLEQLIEVIRDNRGLAPILDLCCDTLGSKLYVGVTYPKTKCYLGIRRRDYGAGCYVNPSLLECCSNTLMVDLMMQTLFINNCYFLAENLGLMSQAVYPRGSYTDRITDVGLCHGLADRSHDSIMNDYLVPWLGRLSRWGRVGLHTVVSVATMARRGVEHKLMCHTLSLGQCTEMKASSLSLLQSSVPITSGSNGGLFHSRASTGGLLKLVGWAKSLGLISGVPLNGVSGYGAELSSTDFKEIDQKFSGVSGPHFLASYSVSNDYTAKPGVKFTMMDTFFYTTPCAGPRAPSVEKGDSVQPRPSSFHVTESVPVPELSSSTEGESSTMESGAGDKVEEAAVEGTVELDNTVDVAEFPYKVGNCGVDALKFLAPDIDIEAGLRSLGLEYRDAMYLHGDELAAIALSHGYSLLVAQPLNQNDFYRHPTSDKILYLRQSEEHFIPQVTTGRREIRRVIESVPVMLPRNDKEKAAMRARIIKNQTVNLPERAKVLAVQQIRTAEAQRSHEEKTPAKGPRTRSKVA